MHLTKDVFEDNNEEKKNRSELFKEFDLYLRNDVLKETREKYDVWLLDIEKKTKETWKKIFDEWYMEKNMINNLFSSPWENKSGMYPQKSSECSPGCMINE